MFLNLFLKNFFFAKTIHFRRFQYSKRKNYICRKLNKKEFSRFLDDQVETVRGYEALQMSKVNIRNENVKTINRFKVESINSGMTSLKT